MYEVLVGQTPFAEGEDSTDPESVDGVDPDNYHDIQIMNRILKGTFSIPERVSSEAADLIKKLLVIDPSKRLTSLRKILKHPWIVKHCGETNLPASKQGRKLYEEAAKLAGVGKKREKPDTADSRATWDTLTSKERNDSYIGNEKAVRRSARLSKRQRKSLSERDLEREASSRREATGETGARHHSSTIVKEETHTEAGGEDPASANTKLETKHYVKSSSNPTTFQMRLARTRTHALASKNPSNESNGRRAAGVVSGPKRVPVKQNRVLSNTTNRQNSAQNGIPKMSHKTESSSTKTGTSSTNKRPANVTRFTSRPRGIVRCANPGAST
eukprot:gb/GECG01012184.1/.p1 GENE.gb/GECG01012184.1/~~gb/GECG01012184.1/.p1  ORF type:complete len:329 (+),score=45.32 gb/GECG01012184.1/:1-987(+)